jgi:FkbH-like protein
MKIGLCGNFNLDALAIGLNSQLSDHEIIVGKDGAFFEELAAPFGDFTSLDLCIIALDWRELTPLLYEFAFGDDPAKIADEFQTQCQRIKKSVESLGSVHAIPVLIFSPINDNHCSAGFINRLLDPSPFDLFAQCQRLFNDLCRALADAYPVDIEEIGACIGKDAAFDPMSRAMSHQPFSSGMIRAVSGHIRAMVAQLRSYPFKCVVLDLDNTLWGGVVGEDGFDRIELGTGGRGKAFVDFQKELLKLYKQGTLLAVCSKNDTCDALDVIERHPHMVIRPGMISCFRVNWDDKPKNVVEIARELNIGLDSMMFIDDSPVERAIMAAALPDVSVLELPAVPELFAGALRACTRFWPVQLTKTDSARAAGFSRNNGRTGLQKISLNKEAYLKDLEIRLVMGRVSEQSIQRAVQLFNKTNQFNLTGARYTQGELERLAGLPGNGLFSMAMTDKFGDYGIIGVALLRADTIESFALSCRAFGRQIELAFLVFMLMHIWEKGHEAAIGKFVSTTRNAMAEGFYKDAGFECISESAGESRWSFDLRQPMPMVPPWIHCCY